MKRIFVFIIILALFSVGALAGDEDALSGDDYMENVGSATPDEARDILPDSVLDGSLSIGDIGVGTFFGIIIRALKGAAPKAAKSFAIVIGLLIISSVVGAFRGTVASKTLGEALDLITTLCVCAAAFSMTEAVFKVAEEFISTMRVFLEALVPTLTVLSAASGNLTFSAASAVTVSAAMTALDAVCNSVAMPMLKICFCISVSSAICGPVDLSGVSAAVKKLLTTVLALSGVAMSAVMIFQRIITKSADSAALRGIKFTVGSLIPFVGSAIGDAISTVSGSVGVMRATVGISGAVIMCTMVILPTAELLINKLFLDIASGAAAMLGLGREKRFLSEMSGVVGFLVALVAFVGTFFIIAVAVIAGTEVSA